MIYIKKPIKFFIAGNVPSSKNSKIITRDKRIINSATVQKYIKNYGHQWKDEKIIEQFKKECKSFPIKLHVIFIRDSKRKFDLINASQFPFDQMVKYGWLPDDDYNHIVPVYEGVEIDKENAGMIFWVE